MLQSCLGQPSTPETCFSRILVPVFQTIDDQCASPTRTGSPTFGYLGTSPGLTIWAASGFFWILLIESQKLWAGPPCLNAFECHIPMNIIFPFHWYTPMLLYSNVEVSINRGTPSHHQFLDGIFHY